MDMKIDKFGFGEVRYSDCFNNYNGLPYLLELIEDGNLDKFDLCLTDLPYNKDSNTTNWQKYNDKLREKKIDYNDKLSKVDYIDFCYKWFDYVKKICKTVVFTFGTRNQKIWLNREEFFDKLYWINKYRRGSTRFTHFNKVEEIFIYGDILNKFDLNVFEYDFAWNNVYDYKDLVHLHPKPRALYEWILDNLKPKTVLDPFLGSGTTAEVCTRLGIKWLGYEIAEVYKHDVDLRLKDCNVIPKIKQDGMF